MKAVWKDILTAAFMGMVLPGILLNFTVMVVDRQPQSAEAKKIQQKETEPPHTRQMMRLRNSGGTAEEMDMDTYLVGVVLAEMPASFESEALKAQSVAARTYTQKAYTTGGKHGDGSVCTRSACCQAYITEESYLAQGGTSEDLEKVRSAVYATSGQVLTYDETLIEATYFACSGGYTEDAEAVWGTDFPYLQAVPSPGEEQAVSYLDTVIYTPREFQNALGTILDGAPYSWFGMTTYTEGGGVATMYIGGQPYTGTQLRELLSLRSTAFAVEAGSEAITITTLGYGHRVGMSQYGADAMAVAGSSYVQILAHYYPGTTLTQLTQ